MGLVNCSREAFDAIVNDRARLALGAKRLDRDVSRGGLVPEGLFADAAGAKLDPATWLHIARADMDGQLAIPQLTLEEQHALVLHLVSLVPDFFDGLFADDTNPGPVELKLAPVDGVMSITSESAYKLSRIDRAVRDQRDPADVLDVAEEAEVQRRKREKPVELPAGEIKPGRTAR